MSGVPKRREMLFRNWHSRGCPNRAVTAAGYCRTHDPDLKADRDTKRPPTKFERWQAARRALDAFIDQQAPEIRDPLRNLYDTEVRLR